MIKTLNINSKFTLLIVTFFIGFIALIGVDLVFKKLFENLDKKTINQEMKIKIGEFIAEDLYKIRSDFYEIATTTSNKRGRELIKKRLFDKIHNIEDSLKIMENGGTLHRLIRLNIAGHNKVIEDIKYDNYNKKEIPLVVIDLRPKLIELKQMVKNLMFISHEKDKNIKKDTVAFAKWAKKLKRYYKSTPAFFTRISENNRRLLYEGGIKLKKLQKSINSKKRYYTIIEFILIFLTITVVGILIKIITKQINNVNKELQNKEIKIQTILDSQPNIIVLSDGEEIVDANIALIEFFDDYKTIDEFNNSHHCICDFFILPKGDAYRDYILDKDYDGERWYKYILNNPNDGHRAAMMKDDKVHHFLITAQTKEFENNEQLIIASLVDITMEIENKEEVLKTGRMAAMGEMIGNIAHQWRQPLSVISTVATGMQLQKEFGALDDDKFNKNCEIINTQVQYLSKTIDDFRNFIKGDRDKKEFYLKDQVDSFMHLMEGSSKSNNIKIILDLDEDIMINGYENELTQCMINIFNNAKDALNINEVKTKLLFITTRKENNNIIIAIKDNAYGIPEDVLPHIFEPYFTTKHKSQGTGLGLHMAYNLVVDGMGGNVNVVNKTYKYEGKEYIGAKFIILLPMK